MYFMSLMTPCKKPKITLTLVLVTEKNERTRTDGESPASREKSDISGLI